MNAHNILVLMSGGLDSSTLAYYLLSKGLVVNGLYVDYGQSMAASEERACRYVTSKKGISLEKIDLRLDERLRAGCLFDPGPKPWDTNDVSFLPQRNLLLLTIAAMYGQKQGISDLYIGVINIGGTPFPDTTNEFLNEAQKVLRRSYAKLRIHAPFSEKSKRDVVAISKDVGVPIDATYSCEMAVDHHCMVCPSCLDRYWALKNRGDE